MGHFRASVTEAHELSQAEDLDFLLRTERTRCHCRGAFQAQRWLRKTDAKRNLKEVPVADAFKFKQSEVVGWNKCEQHSGY
jgi:hypothetical protein